MLKLLRYLKPYWLQCIALILMIAVQAWGTLLLPAYMEDIINDGIVKQDIGYIWFVGGKMLIAALIGAIGTVGSNFFSARIGTAFSRDLRADIFAKVLSLGTAEIDQFNTASLITRTTNDVNQVQRAVILCLSMLIRAPIMCIGAIILAISTAPNMTWIIVAGVVAVIVIISSVFAIVVPKFKILQTLTDRITMLTRENLTGLRVVRAFNNEKLEEQKFERANHDFTKTMIFINKIMSLPMPLISLIFNGTTILCSWIGISLLSADIAYLGKMIAFAQYAGQVIMSFLILSFLFIVLPRANISAKRINEVLLSKIPIRWQTETKGMANKTPSVEFRNVSFAYPDADEKILQEITFTANAGETTAFIGSTGSGKSTLINLVPRFHEATGGEILINDINIKDYNKDDLMQKIGHVPQKGTLFAGTVAENIAFGAPKITEKQIKEAAEIAQAAEFIEKLPKKYQSEIAQGGTNVSGGQKQRLSIARAIAKNPEILIFDDAFSALDMKTDAKLRQALVPVTKNTVTLIVAQRISTIKDAEQIIVLNEGKIVGKGTHYQLLKKCKVYREIAKSQLSDLEFEKEMNHA